MGVSARRVFTHQECRSLPTAQVYSELLDELRQSERPPRMTSCLHHDRAERVHEHQSGRVGLDFLDDSRQYPVKLSQSNIVAQIDETNRVIDPVELEISELLLITEHLQRRLTEHGEKYRRPLLRRHGEHQLVRERRL